MHSSTQLDCLIEQTLSADICVWTQKHNLRHYVQDRRESVPAELKESHNHITAGFDHIVIWVDADRIVTRDLS